MLKKTFFNYKIKIKIKTTTTTGLKNELKYSKGLVWFFLVKVFKDNVQSDDTYKVSLLHYPVTTDGEVNRNLACVIFNYNNSSYQRQI